MYWELIIVLEQRGTKQESLEIVSFDSQEDAESAASKLEDDYRRAGPDEFLTVSSNGKRVSFLKQDFRRTRTRKHQPSVVL